MQKFFVLSFQHKMILAVLLLMNVPFFLTGYAAKSLTENIILREKEEKLLALARVLDMRLGPGGFAAIIEQAGAEGAPREDKIKILNEALRESTDEVGSSAPGLGVGFYCRELDAIVTYGPSAEFGHTIGLSIPQDHPGRLVMRSGTELVRSGTMVRGDILNAMLPVTRKGEVIGYIWANELTTDVSAQLAHLGRGIFTILGICFLLTLAFLLLLSRRTVRDVERIIRGVREMRHDLSRRIEGAGGELGEVVSSINAMAEEIGTANRETHRAVAVLRNVMDNVDAAVYVCDPQSNVLVYSNKYLNDLMGRTDMQGKPCYEMLFGRSEPCPVCPHQRLFDDTGNPILAPIQREEYNYLAGRDFLLTDRLISWHDGRLLHMQVGADITERKALAMAEAANAAQKDFLARMSHEIRTPMNGVLGMTHLAMQSSPPPAQMEYLKKIQDSASLLLGIINDILDFSRIEAGKIAIEKQNFNLHELVENIRELILPRIRENNLSLRVTLDDSVPVYVVGDSLRLSQVLLNLLGNAAKFTPAGSVSLDMRSVPLPSEKLRLTCDIRDSGIGMTEEQQAALFKPFSQANSSTSRKFGGTGLGLSICKALVELMGGSISVRSKEGEGSVFSFFVDLEPDKALPRAERAAQPKLWENVRYGGCRFLLVEDNLINQEISQAILTQLGAEVDIAGNGEEAVRAFLDKEYSLIFMDVRMPVMDGIEATRRIRASAKQDAATVPIIAMTANAMQEDREASRNAGMNGHIAKPIDLSELKSVLFDLLGKNKDG